MPVFVKKCLTNGASGANICESPAGDAKNQKKFEKTRKKFLTNRIACDNITWLCDERRKPGAQQTAQKNLKKLVKKCLTNSTRCARISKFAANEILRNERVCTL